MKILSFRTLAEFKRLAIVGHYIRGSYYEKPQANSWRIIKKAQTNGCFLASSTSPSGFSFFEFPKAKDCEIEADTLKIYQHRVKYGGSDIPVETRWFQFDLKRGKIKPEECVYYTKQIAEYQIGEAESGQEV